MPLASVTSNGSFGLRGPSLLRSMKTNTFGMPLRRVDHSIPVLIQPDGVADGKRTDFDAFGVLCGIVVGYGGIRPLDQVLLPHNPGPLRREKEEISAEDIISVAIASESQKIRTLLSMRVSLSAARETLAVKTMVMEPRPARCPP